MCFKQFSNGNPSPPQSASAGGHAGAMTGEGRGHSPGLTGEVAGLGRRVAAWVPLPGLLHLPLVEEVAQPRAGIQAVPGEGRHPPALIPSPPWEPTWGGGCCQGWDPRGGLASLSHAWGLEVVFRPPCSRSAARAESVPHAGPSPAPGSKDRGGGALLQGCPSVCPSVQEDSAHPEGLEHQGFARSSTLTPLRGPALGATAPGAHCPGGHCPGQEGSGSRAGGGKGKQEMPPQHGCNETQAGGLRGHHPHPTPFTQQRFGAGARCHEGCAKLRVAKPIPGPKASPWMVMSPAPAPAGAPGRDRGRGRGSPAPVGGGRPKPGSGGCCQHRAAGPRPGHRGELTTEGPPGRGGCQVCG